MNLLSVLFIPRTLLLILVSRSLSTELGFKRFSQTMSLNQRIISWNIIFSNISLGGLPEFSEIIQMVILQDKLICIVKNLSGWYMGHYGAHDRKTSPSKEVKLVEPQELHDTYAVAGYKFRGMLLITLKRYVHV